MRGSLLGYPLLLLATALFAIKAVSVFARFSAFAGASEVVALSRWQWSDGLRLGGAIVLGKAAGAVPQQELRNAAQEAPAGPPCLAPCRPMTSRSAS